MPTPVVKKVTEVDFYEALRMALEGKRIRRLDWPDERVYGLMRQGFLMLHKDDDEFYTWTLVREDMIATDWVEA